MGRLMKKQGPIWLGLTDRSASVRPYGYGDIARMVARSAYAQLSYSPLLLAGTLAGLFLVFAAGPAGVFCTRGLMQLAAVLSWMAMVLAYAPMLRFYRLSGLWGIALPLVGALYGLFTLDSAIQHWRGRGGMWKGRAQAMGQT
jgi:hypothetical protein